MDTLIPEGIRQIAQQGTGWLIACFVTAALVWMYRTSSRRLDELQEKRITEARDTVKTLHEGAQANVRVAQSQEEQAATREALKQLMMEMDRDIERNNEAWKPEVANIQRKLDEILNELRRRAG